MSSREKKPPKNVKVLVLGATGAGKSSLINLFYVWSKDLKPADFVSTKKVLIKTEHLDGDGAAERNVQNQGESQTNFAKNYQFKLTDPNNGFEYSLDFLDTPGMGDTRGVDFDEKNLDCILDTVSKTENLNAILLVMNGAEARISQRVQYIITKLENNIPDILANNLVILLTNVDLVPNLDINRVLANSIPRERLFYYNNQLFKLSPKDLEDHNVQRRINNSFTNSIDVLADLMKVFCSCTVKPTKAFKQIKESRDKLKKKLTDCNDADVEIYRKIQELQSLATDVAEGKLKVSDLQKKLNQVVTEEVFESTPTVHHNTTCLTCKYCCHENCGLQEIGQEGNSLFMQCAAFSGNETCQMCNHNYASHVHLKIKYIKTTKQVPKVDPNVQKAIQEAENNSNSKEVASNSLNGEINKLKKKLEKHHQEIKDIIDEMRQVCSGFDYMKEVNACIGVLEEQLELVTNEFSQTPNQQNSLRVAGLTETINKMKKFKEDLMIHLGGEDNSSISQPAQNPLKKRTKKSK